MNYCFSILQLGIYFSYISQVFQEFLSLNCNVKNKKFYKNLLTALIYIIKYDNDTKNPPKTSLV